MKIFLIFLLFSCSTLNSVQQTSDSSNEEISSPDQEEGNSDTLTQKKKFLLRIIGRGPDSMTFVGILKNLHNYEIEPQAVNGTGLGSLIAALYAKYKKISMVEWIVFKYFNKKLPSDVSSGEEFWSSYQDLLTAEFETIENEQLKIPYLTKNNRKIFDELIAQMNWEKSLYQKGFYPRKSQACYYPAARGQYYTACLQLGTKEKNLSNSVQVIYVFSLSAIKSHSLIDLVETGEKISHNRFIDLKDRLLTR